VLVYGDESTMEEKLEILVAKAGRVRREFSGRNGMNALIIAVDVWLVFFLVMGSKVSLLLSGAM